MTKQDLLNFVRSSALAALDNGDGFADPVNSYRENLIDTMTDEKVTGDDYHDAIALFDQLVVRS